MLATDGLHSCLFRDYYHMVDGEGAAVGKAAPMAVVRRMSAGEAREH